MERKTRRLQYEQRKAALVLAGVEFLQQRLAPDLNNPNTLVPLLPWSWWGIRYRGEKWSGFASLYQAIERAEKIVLAAQQVDG